MDAKYKEKDSITLPNNRRTLTSHLALHSQACSTPPASTMVVFLTNFILDAFGLFADELLLSAAECARQANSYWHTLGENDQQRTKRFDSMVQARFTWNGNIRSALARALGDLRAYSFKPEKNELVPSSKKRTCTVAVATDPVQVRDEYKEYEHETL
ncbi:unnamed protein product [Cylicocyclus nassatus]|uniref:Uncharacterized protein n=1 Tax=Cylicocyclus nassatus TaxID=53992 RepID=A0AA36GZ92_CYLNA|nr:unnamed protein product [Cylicocyclus nassatus]